MVHTLTYYTNDDTKKYVFYLIDEERNIILDTEENVYSSFSNDCIIEFLEFINEEINELLFAFDGFEKFIDEADLELENIRSLLQKKGGTQYAS